MLLEFTVSNFLSFRTETTFSMLASDSDEAACFKDLGTLSLPGGSERALKFAALFGPNGAGKSNLLRSIQAMRETVLCSACDDGVLSRLSERACRLDDAARTEPSFFEIIFAQDGILYRYGFEFVQSRITHEWLFRKAPEAVREKRCFIRRDSAVGVNPRVLKHAKSASVKMRDSELFLSACERCGVQEASGITAWFREKLIILPSDRSQALKVSAELFLLSETMRRDILGFMKQFDPSLSNIRVTKGSVVENSPRQPEGAPASSEPKVVCAAPSETDFRMFFERSLGRSDRQSGAMRTPSSSESPGIQNAFAFAGPWFEALRRGATLLADDFGAGMHGTAVNELVRAFLQSPHAQTQLIAATHETCLLTAELLRRDQIWFVQKNDSAGSELYSLLEFRTDPAHPAAGNTCRCRDYLSGRYGAVPQISRPEPFLGAAGSPTTVSENLPH